MWKQGRTIRSDGYVLIRVGKDHHLSDSRGYTYEHQLVMEEKLGRRLVKGEIVHHKDENPGNNDPDNLVLKANRAEHALAHRIRDKGLRLPDEPNPTIECACGCGGLLEKFDYQGRPRKRLFRHTGRYNGRENCNKLV